jgi:antitoxin component YwqK of YwqJK toxin-antitoxin module
MKFTILILLFFTITGFSQEIKYDLYLKDSCQNTIEKTPFYHLEKKGIKYKISNFDGTILLPNKGQYKLIASELEEEFNITIDKLINSDTLNLPKIVEKQVWPPYSYKSGLNKEVQKKIQQKNLPTFWECNERYNGKLIDYYSNGKIKISGILVNGLPIGKLKRYYQNGEIKEVSVYDKEGFLTKRTLFNEKGKIKTE